MAAFHTPASHGTGYAYDVAGFEAARGARRLLLRRAHADEAEDAIEAVALVIAPAPGIHTVEVIWRGEPFFPASSISRYLAAGGDAAVAGIVTECARRGGKATPGLTRDR